MSEEWWLSSRHVDDSAPVGERIFLSCTQEWRTRSQHVFLFVTLCVYNAFGTVAGDSGSVGEGERITQEVSLDEKLARKSTLCYLAGDDMASRDAACQGDLVCARVGHDGRNFGECPNEYCCSVPPDTDRVIVAICTDSVSDPRNQQMFQRLDSLGWEAHWLNCSQAFTEVPTLWGVRLSRYKDFVEHEITGNPLVIFVDGYDVIPLGTPDEALRTFPAFGKPLVTACVNYPWPPPGNCSQYNWEPPPLPKYIQEQKCSYPCGGGVMGYRSALQGLYAMGNFSEHTDDQCWLYRILRLQKTNDNDWTFDQAGDVVLDYTIKKSFEFAFDMERGRYTIKRDGVAQRPVFVHLDGSHLPPDGMKEVFECSVNDTSFDCNVPRFFPAPMWWNPTPAYVKRVLQLRMKRRMMKAEWDAAHNLQGKAELPLGLRERQNAPHAAVLGRIRGAPVAVAAALVCGAILSLAFGVKLYRSSHRRCARQGYSEVHE